MGEGHDDHGGHHPQAISGVALRVKALESLLLEKGLIASDAIERVVQRYEKDIGPLNGAKVVARAWTDPAYRSRLLSDATAAIEELGFGGMQGERMLVLENTVRTHNVVCCTLCSCYPWPVLGLPPAWYKAPAYRSRIVREPRKVLSEFGLNLSEKIEVRVWDSSAELRYMVLPLRPAHTESMSEQELAALVTRDALIGVGLALDPKR